MPEFSITSEPIMSSPVMTVSADHYMRVLTDEQLRNVLAAPRLYSVGERLDADAILQERRHV